ncbi:MAG: type II toxin-antitoxin system VapC family toxin [Anaerolineae bacterium]|nr:type II toxin-antitoxin system VapC family toxin [Anaerolineae bacterium]
MKLYLDTVILIEYLYNSNETERTQAVSGIFELARQETVELFVSFYTLPELWGYVDRSYPPHVANLVLRESLVVLFSEPITVVPQLNRTDINILRRRFKIRDSYDALHVACALFYNSDAILTYDFHFQSVANTIPVKMPQDVVTLFSPQ